MKTAKFLTLGLLAGMLAFTSCNSDDDGHDKNHPEHIQDHDEIDQMVVTVTPVNGGKSANYTFNAGDKQGQKITIDKGVPYTFEVTEMNSREDGKFHDEIKEVKEEKEEHFFVYQTDLKDFTFERADNAETTRADGTKIGLKVNITVNEAQTGKTLSFELKHQPNKVDPKAKNGLGATEGGATDLLVTFPIDVVAK